MTDDRRARRSALRLQREEQLAARLRENLRLRKAQAREQAGAASAAIAEEPQADHDAESVRLPKSPPES